MIDPAPSRHLSSTPFSRARPRHLAAMKKDPRSDEALYQAHRDGDRSAGAHLYDRYFLSIRAFFINRVADPASWDDLAQKTFMTVLYDAANFRGASTFQSYMFGVARHILLADYRKRKNHAARHALSDAEIEDLPVADIGKGNSTLAAERAEVQRLINALRQIPIKHQAVFELYYWQDLPASEIAKIQDVPLGTVRGRLRLAKKALLDKLGLQRGTFGELLRSFRSVEAWALEVRAQLAGEGELG